MSRRPTHPRERYPQHGNVFDVIEHEFPCVCHRAYSDRGLVDPDCVLHDAVEAAETLIDAGLIPPRLVLPADGGAEAVRQLEVEGCVVLDRYDRAWQAFRYDDGGRRAGVTFVPAYEDDTNNAEGLLVGYGPLTVLHGGVEA